MAQVTLDVGGRRYELAVREGQEDHFLELGAVVDAKVRAVSRSMGTINEPRQLLMAALLLADEQNAPAPAAPPVPTAPAPASNDDAKIAAEQIDALASRLERLALLLEKNVQAS